MKRNLIWLALAMSVLFNVFFVVGFARARAQLEAVQSSNGASRVVASELNLNDEQRAVFSTLRAGMRDEMASLRDEVTLVQEDLVAELGMENPDLERVRNLVARKADLDRQRQLIAVRRFGEFVDILSPEQCRRLSGKVHHGRRGARWRERLLKKFDADGDGELNEQERAAAREYMESRRQEWEERRQKMLERFDADGNGHLDPEERDAMWEWR
ncbi:MAG: periplasmic heavy metal sensor, partial [Planctomycetota bacterium]